MAPILTSLLTHHAMELFIVSFIIALAYFGYIFYWANQHNNRQLSDAQAAALPPEAFWYLVAKEYKPRSFIPVLLKWQQQGAINLSLNDEGNFTLLHTGQPQEHQALFNRLFAKHDTIDFGPFHVSKAIAKTTKKFKKEIKTTFASAFNMQWLPFIVGLIVSALPVVPLVYNEQILWAPVAALMIYLNLRAYHALHLYSKEGQGYRAYIKQQEATLQKGSTLDDLTAALPISLALHQEDSLAQRFKHLVRPGQLISKEFTPLWLIPGYGERNLGKQLIDALSVKKYR